MSSETEECNLPQPRTNTGTHHSNYDQIDGERETNQNEAQSREDGHREDTDPILGKRGRERGREREEREREGGRESVREGEGGRERKEGREGGRKLYITYMP